jgi:dihydroxyacetone kinase-like predicted kinase
LARVFQSLGTSAIVHGGQTMNPSTQDLLEAIENLACDQVVLLPNNSNVILAAEQASKLSDKPVAVIPSRSIPQGIAALLAINSQADFETNVASMTNALEDIEVGEVTSATRSVTINGIDVADGQIIGLHNGELKVAGTTVEEVVQALLEELDTAEREIVTLYYGEDVDESEANALADHLAQNWPDQEIEVVAGNQPHYYYFLSVE